MYDESHFTRDAATATFDDDASGITVDDDGDVRIDWDDVETVRVENPPHASAFDSKEFYKLPATVAKPIAQQYRYGEDAVTLKKPREELKKAAWSLDNAPWTMGHPDTGMVKDVGDVRGFWDDTRYIDGLDDLDSDLHVPVGDDEAKRYIEQHGDVSVGFYNRVARTDTYDGVVGGSDDDGSVDGYQTDMLFDHCASVPVGRCSGEEGCGIDAGPHGTMTQTDSVTMSAVDETHGMSNGDWVKWDSSGGMAHGRIDEVIMDGCTTRGKGDKKVCAEDDDPAVVIKVYDDESGELTDTLVRHKMSTLSAWDGPSTADSDSFKRDTRITHESDDSDVASMESHVDQPSGIKSVDGDWFAVGPDEHTKDSTDHPEDHMFPVGGCGDVDDAWRLRGQTDNLEISEETLARRIIRAAEAQNCTNVADTLQERMDSPTEDCGCDDTDTNDMTFDFEIDDLSTEAALAKVASNHDGVEERLDELRKTEDKADAAEAAADELDLDDVSELSDAVAMKEERIEELQDTVEELQRPMMEEDAEFIAERTERFGEDADEVLEELDYDADTVAEKRKLVEDLTEDYDEATANSGGEESDSGITTDSRGYASTPW